jgi:hypothetical protein
VLPSDAPVLSSLKERDRTKRRDTGVEVKCQLMRAARSALSPGVFAFALGAPCRIIADGRATMAVVS